MKAQALLVFSLAVGACGDDRHKGAGDQPNQKAHLVSNSHSPAHYPEATILYPTLDPKMRYDREKNIVVDERNGHHMEYSVDDKRDLMFTFHIWDGSSKEFTAYPGRALAYEKPGYGRTTAFEIFGALPSDYPKSPPLYADKLSLERLARFINSNWNLHSYVGNAVVIDNREKYRRTR